MKAINFYGAVMMFPFIATSSNDTCVIGLRTLGSKIRKLALIGVTTNFELDFCSFPTFWINGVVGKELQIVDDGLLIECSCLTAFFRKYGKLHL